jgi:hypothetical protein
MIKCPRCKLPQEEGRKCRYCGYDLTGAKKSTSKSKPLEKGLKKSLEGLKNCRMVSRIKENKLHSTKSMRTSAIPVWICCFPYSATSISRIRQFESIIAGFQFKQNFNPFLMGRK